MLKRLLIVDIYGVLHLLVSTSSRDSQNSLERFVEGDRGSVTGSATGSVGEGRGGAD